MEEEAEKIRQEALEEGADTAIRWLFDRAGTSQQVPLTIDNQTITIMAAECLQT